MNVRLFGIFFFFFSSLFSQSDPNITPQEAISKYFKVPRETLFLHLNKSTYISGEEIWFKGYVYDRKNKKPSLKTANFNVELFDDKGKEMFSGLFLGSQGSTKGSIRVDSTLTSGNYYVRISTNWMNNFIEDDSYTKRIKLVTKRKSKAESKVDIKYDFQLMPEGGHLVAVTNNTVGFKITNHLGYGVGFIEGEVVDDMGVKVKSFKSNRFGIGKFNILPVSGKKYTAIIKLRNGKEIKASFPKVQDKGIAMSINNLFPERVVIELNWNIAKQKDVKEKVYYLLVHQNHLSKKIIVNFPVDATNRNISIDRKEIFSGINTITLFEDNVPVSERILFNTTDNTIPDLKVTYLNTVRDSLIFSVNLPPQLQTTYDLSVSVLPNETKSYNHDDNILSAMLLKPHVRGYIEDSKYYFTNVDRRKIYDLDLLLLTQGWSKYEWKNKFDYKSNYQYSFNQGLTIRGRIQGVHNKGIAQAYLFPTKNSAYRLIDLDSTKGFTINNFFVEKGEDIIVSALNSNGLPIKTGFYLSIDQNRTKKTLSKKSISPVLENTSFIDGNSEVPKGFFEGVENLDEVLLTGKKSQKQDANNQSFFYRENSEKITERDAQIYQNVIDYIKIKGGKFRVRVNPDAQTVDISSRSQITLIGGNKTTIYIDDVLIGDPNILLSIFMQDVESIYMDGSGFGEGLRGAGGVIRIYSRKTALENVSSQSGMTGVVSKHKAKKGFELVKKYYQPGYNNYLDQFFINTGVIHWEPKLILNEKGAGIIKIPNTSLENISFFIEGMGSNGSLISKIHTLSLKLK